MSVSMRDASVYTELSGLQAISQLGRENSEEGLREVAKQFEAMFLNIMLKGMRAGEETLFSDNYLRSNEMSFHRENLDNQLALHMSATGGIGLAETLHRQLMQRYEPARAAGSTDAPVFSGDLDAVRRFEGPRPVAVRPVTDHQAQVAVTEDSAITTVAVVSTDAIATATAGQPSGFASPEAFVAHLRPIAEKYARELGVDADVLLAQSALETGWGQKMIRGANGEPSYNLFGIKANSNWQGDRVNVGTLEYRNGAMHRETASFRAYASYEDSFADYVQLLRSQPRYASALQHAADPAAYTRHLQQAGYATDPDYAEKIRSVMRSPSLVQASVNHAYSRQVN